MSEIEIVSDGTAFGTICRLKSGEVINHVTHIEILPISPGDVVSARITVAVVKLKMTVPKAEINQEIVDLADDTASV